VLDLVHSNVFGLINVPSLSKSVYFVSFINDYSRRTWIYFLRSKSEVYSKFKEFKAFAENQTGKKIKCLRTDNGGDEVIYALFLESKELLHCEMHAFS